MKNKIHVGNTFPTIAKDRLKAVGEDLLKRNAITHYSLKTDDGVVFEALRKKDNVPITIDIHPGEEIIIRTFDHTYSDTLVTSGYLDEEEQLEGLDDAIDDIRFFMEEKDYYEEIYERNGQIIFKRLIRSSGYKESKSVVFAGRIKRFFGSSKKIVRPR